MTYETYKFKPQLEKAVRGQGTAPYEGPQHMRKGFPLFGRNSVGAPQHLRVEEGHGQAVPNEASSVQIADDERVLTGSAQK